MDIQNTMEETGLEEIRILLDDSEPELLDFSAVAEDGAVIGLLQVRIEPVQYAISGLYVEPEYRERGIGTGLINTFLACLDDEIIMPCSMTFTEDEGGESLAAFMASRNDFFTIDAGMSYWTGIKKLLTFSPIVKQIEKGYSKNVKDFGELTNKDLELLINDLRELELAKIDTVEGMKNYYEPNLSTVCLNGDSIYAALLVHRLSAKEVMIDVMYTNNNSIAAMEVMAKTVRKILDADPETMLSIFTINDNSEDFVDRILELAGDVKKSRTYISNWLMIPGSYPEDEDDEYEDIDGEYEDDEY